MRSARSFHTAWKAGIHSAAASGVHPWNETVKGGTVLFGEGRTDGAERGTKVQPASSSWRRCGDWRPASGRACWRRSWGSGRSPCTNGENGSGWAGLWGCAVAGVRRRRRRWRCARRTGRRGIRKVCCRPRGRVGSGKAWRGRSAGSLSLSARSASSRWSWIFFGEPCGKSGTSAGGAACLAERHLRGHPSADGVRVARRIWN